MPSARKIAANRANARKSTGPRTKEGKSRSRGNAERHGLEAVSLTEAERTAEVEHLAKAICPDQADPFRFEQAVIIAGNELLLARVRAAKRVALGRDRGREDALRQKSGPARRRGDLGLEEEPNNPNPPEVGDEAEWARRALPELLRLERYARRALSRRKRAIRRFDALGE
jgi:hypothetical protein